jgi:hypothetical protein
MKIKYRGGMIECDSVIIKSEALYPKFKMERKLLFFKSLVRIPKFMQKYHKPISYMHEITYSPELEEFVDDYNFRYRFKGYGYEFDVEYDGITLNNCHIMNHNDESIVIYTEA